MGPGTGLGEGILTKSTFSKCHEIFSSEGGHVDFAPTNEREIELLRFLMPQYPGHVSYERVVSGMGLVNIYQFINQKL